MGFCTPQNRHIHLRFPLESINFKSSSSSLLTGATFFLPVPFSVLFAVLAVGRGADGSITVSACRTFSPDFPGVTEPFFFPFAAELDSKFEASAGLPASAPPRPDAVLRFFFLDTFSDCASEGAVDEEVDGWPSAFLFPFAPPTETEASPAKISSMSDLAGMMVGRKEDQDGELENTFVLGPKRLRCLHNTSFPSKPVRGAQSSRVNICERSHRYRIGEKGNKKGKQANRPRLRLLLFHLHPKSSRWAFFLISLFSKASPEEAQVRTLVSYLPAMISTKLLRVAFVLLITLSSAFASFGSHRLDGMHRFRQEPIDQSWTGALIRTAHQKETESSFLPVGLPVRPPLVCFEVNRPPRVPDDAIECTVELFHRGFANRSVSSRRRLSCAFLRTSHLITSGVLLTATAAPRWSSTLRTYLPAAYRQIVAIQRPG